MCEKFIDAGGIGTLPCLYIEIKKFTIFSFVYDSVFPFVRRKSSIQYKTVKYVQNLKKNEKKNNNQELESTQHETDAS